MTGDVEVRFVTPEMTSMHSIYDYPVFHQFSQKDSPEFKLLLSQTYLTPPLEIDRTFFDAPKIIEGEARYSDDRTWVKLPIGVPPGAFDMDFAKQKDIHAEFFWSSSECKIEYPEQTPKPQIKACAKLTYTIYDLEDQRELCPHEAYIDAIGDVILTQSKTSHWGDPRRYVLMSVNTEVEV